MRKAIDELGKVKDGCEYGEVMIDIGNRIIEFCKRMPTEDIEMK